MRRIVAQLGLLEETHLVESFFFFLSTQLSLFACASQSRAVLKLKLDRDSVVHLYSKLRVRWRGSDSCYWALVYCCSLPFTRLEARPSPELIGLWSGGELRSSHSLTASSRTQQAGRGEVTAKVFQVKRPPQKIPDQTAGFPQRVLPSAWVRIHFWYPRLRQSFSYVTGSLF